MFEDLFKSRLNGNSAKIPRAMEAAFLDKPKTAGELRIAKYIRDFHAIEIKEAKAELSKQSKQSKRLADAEKALLGKTTKKAQNDHRVSAAKIEKLEFKIERLESGKIGESDSRIWPGQYAPLIVMEDGERLIRPFRYHLRPFGKDSGFDRKFDGNYNARRDRLKEVFWWKSIYGKSHGALPIKAFFENVPLSKTRKLKKGEDDYNLVLRFDPQGLDEMLVPCIFDKNEEEEFTLHSFAIITDEPNSEVAAAGHDRTPIIMKPSHLDLWLSTDGKDLREYDLVFNDKQRTYFEHEIAA